MEQRIGEITNPTDQLLKDSETGTEKNYENPARIPVDHQDPVDYIEIIAQTPNGDEVINILKGKR